jgi:hypothetical protein
VKRWELSRRTFLRGAGATLALPLLEQMWPSVARAQAAGSGSPRRLVVFYVPNGIHMDSWTPKEEGADWQMTKLLAPLAPVKSKLLVLSGLSHTPGFPDGDGHHAAATSSFLTCTKVFKTMGADIQNDISADQVIANHLRGTTPLPSLELGNEARRGTGNCDSGYACSYANNISWSGPTTPMPKESNPRAVLERLTAIAPTGTAIPPEQLRELRRQRSVLDLVSEDATQLQSRLGTTDRRKLDEYLTGIRDLEQRIDQIESGSGPACSVPGSAPDQPSDIGERTRAMSDLIVLALQCDLTRVVTFMHCNARSNWVYDFLGLNGTHHGYSHHQYDPANYAALEKINHWEVEQFAYLVQKMDAIRDPSGASLLDSSLVYFNSEVEDGNRHGHSNLPVLLAGSGGGAVRSGRHLRYRQKEPIADLMISLMGYMGVQRQRFGDDGTGPLAGLT